MASPTSPSCVRRVLVGWTLQLLFVLGLSSTSCALQQPPPVATPAASALNVNVNVPALVELVKTPEARTSTLEKAAFLSQSARYLIPTDAVTVKPPADIKGFVQQALSGQAAVTLDAAGVGDGNTPLSQKVDLQILASDWGALTVQIRNPLVPKLPLAGLPDTPPIVTNMVAPAVADAAPAALEVAQKVVDKVVAADGATSFWDTPIRDGTVTIDFPNGNRRALTPLDILGSSSLALGAAYAGSYAYYVAEQEREAKRAEEMKLAMAAKRKAAAAAKKKKEGDKVSTPKMNMPKPKKTKPTPAVKVEKVEPVGTVGTAATSTALSMATTATPTSTVSQEAETPPVKEKVVLPNSSEPQLQRSIPHDKSIAMAEEKEEDKVSDKDSIPSPKKERKGIRGRIFGVFKRLLRKS